MNIMDLGNKLIFIRHINNQQKKNIFFLGESTKKTWIWKKGFNFKKKLKMLKVIYFKLD